MFSVRIYNENKEQPLNEMVCPNLWQVYIYIEWGNKLFA